MKVVGVQMDIAWEDKRANFAKVETLLAAETIAPDSLIVLPEMFATGFSMNVDKICERESGETETFLGSLAEKYQSCVIGGVVTRAHDGRGRNEALFIEPSGKDRVSRYCKRHPFSYGGEDKHYAPGREIAVVRTGGLSIAPFICYDLRFPEIFRDAVQYYTDCFVVIANWPQAREAHWTTLLQARAIENQAYVVGVNRCGSDPRHAYSGRSLIVDPRGTILADAGNTERVIQADLDPEEIAAWRREFPALLDMRPEYCRTGVNRLRNDLPPQRRTRDA
jgi:predicted amidohydrolase